MLRSLLKKRVVGEAAWIFAGQVTAAAGMLIGIRVLTEVVPPDVFGTVTLVVGAVTLAQNVFCQPLVNAMVRFHPEKVSEGESGRLRRVGYRLLLRFGGWSVGVILLGGGIYSFITGRSYGVALAAAGLLVVSVLKMVQMEMANARRNHRRFALWQAGDAWLRPFLAIALVFALGAAAGPVLVGYALAGLLMFVSLSLLTANRTPPPEPDPEKEKTLARELWVYALPLAPTALFTWFNQVGDRYIIGGMLGLEEVGIYAASYTLIYQAFWFPYLLLHMVTRPIYYEAVALGDSARAERVFRNWLGALALVGMVGFILVALLKDWITWLLLNRQYWAGADLMPWFAGAFVLLYFATVLRQPLFARKRTKPILFARFCSAVAAVALIIWLTWAFGLTGAAAACSIYFGFEIAMIGWMNARSSKIGQR